MALRYLIQAIHIFLLFCSFLKAQDTDVGKVIVLSNGLKAELDVLSKILSREDSLETEFELNDYDIQEHKIKVTFERQVGIFFIGGDFYSKREGLDQETEGHGEDEAIMRYDFHGIIGYDAPLDVTITGHIGKDTTIIEIDRDFSLKDNISLEVKQDVKFSKDSEFNNQLQWSFETYLFYALKKHLDFSIKYKNENFRNQSLGAGIRINF